MNLGELKELEAKATPGPWKLDKPGKAPYTIISRNGGWETLVANISWLADAEDNGPFILAMRNALPELIAEIEKLRTEQQRRRRAAQPHQE